MAKAWERRLEEICADTGTRPAYSTLRALVLGLTEEPHPATRFTSPESIVDQHLADSLAGLEALPLPRHAERIADLGSGAGFPGLALAAALPAARVDLIEASGRKAAAIERLASFAGLENTRVVAARAETWAATEGGTYSLTTARALAPAAVVVEYAAPLLAIGGLLLLWKGTRDAREEAAGSRAALGLGLEVDRVLEVTPFPAARNRHLHLYRKIAETPARFPRRPGSATKRPLASR